MPTYRFLNNETGEEYEEFMRISELDSFLETNPHITQLVNGAPMIHSGRGLGKPEQGFRDLLKDIKKRNSGGLSKSTIDNY